MISATSAGLTGKRNFQPLVASPRHLALLTASSVPLCDTLPLHHTHFPFLFPFNSSSLRLRTCYSFLVSLSASCPHSAAMSDSERSPLLSTDAESPDPTSNTSSESTPLLSGSDTPLRYGVDVVDAQDDAAAATSVRSLRSHASSTKSSGKGSRRWPSIIAMIFLAILSISIIVLAFFVPEAVEKYAKEAVVLEPTGLAIQSITASGVQARIRANFRLDSSRVRNEHVRRVGRVATWLVRALGTEDTTVSVYLPEYGNILLGTAAVPPLVIDIMDGHRTAVDFVTELSPGDAEGIRTIANEWLEGRLDLLRVQGKADIQLKSGIIPLGTQNVVESLVLEGQYLYRSFAALYFGEKSLFK